MGAGRVSAGAGHTAVIARDGSMWTWGGNSDGQLGDGTTAGRSLPARVQGGAVRWAFVSAGEGHTMAIAADGSLWGWGSNRHGWLGDGSTTARLSPTRIQAGRGWAAVSAGYEHTMAIAADGSLWGWGSNQHGRLGDGTTTVRHDPVHILPGTEWDSVSAGITHTMAIAADGSLWGWGSNERGQLGDGSTTVRRSPVRIGADEDWAFVSAGRYHTVAIRKDGSLWTWGRDTLGHFDGGGSVFAPNTPEPMDTDGVWAMVSAGETHTAAVRADGSLWTWGSNSSGRLGDGTAEDSGETPVPVRPGTLWASVSAGEGHTVALGRDGSFWVWGDEMNGQLGNGHLPTTLPTQVAPGSLWQNVSAGNLHTVAVRTDGSLWAWGNNEFGQLGDGTRNESYAPVRVGEGRQWTSAAAGESHTMAIAADGSLWGWGRNDHGQIGDGTRTEWDENEGTIDNDRLVPTRIGSGTDWVSVSAGRDQTIAVRADGSLWAWGDNAYGQLGDSTRTELDRWVDEDGEEWVIFAAFEISPMRVGADSDWLSASSGGKHTVAVRRDGSLWAWGLNNFGQAGTGMTEIEAGDDDGETITILALTNPPAPVRISDASFGSVSAGAEHNLAVGADGSLWAWGSNHFGQIGDGATLPVLTPAQVQAGAAWIFATAGGNLAWSHSAAIREDGTLWTWGFNEFGQLGDGTRVDRSEPVQVSAGAGSVSWVSVSAGRAHTAAITADGSLWVWGDNASGQIGNGERGFQNAPIRVVF